MQLKQGKSFSQSDLIVLNHRDDLVPGGAGNALIPIGILIQIHGRHIDKHRRTRINGIHIDAAGKKRILKRRNVRHNDQL